MLEKLLDSLKKAFDPTETATLPDPFDTYYDEKAKLFCIGELPLNIKKEAARMIETKLDSNESFDRASLDSLQLSAKGREVFDTALAQLCFWIGKLVGTKKRRKGDSLYPWKCAVCLVPTTRFNAWVRLSFDEKENTALIFLNIGVLLENLDRLHRIHATPGYLDSIINGSKGKLAPEVPTDQCDGYLANFSANPRLHAIATEVAIKASMLVVFHEYAHFICGHVSYLKAELDHSEGIHEAPEELDKVLAEELRRHMEFDADETAGTMASIFWREFDHPAVAPEDMKNEAFSIEVIPVSYTHLTLPTILLV